MRKKNLKCFVRFVQPLSTPSNCNNNFNLIFMLGNMVLIELWLLQKWNEIGFQMCVYVLCNEVETLMHVFGLTFVLLYWMQF